ncbi:hypothetical protein WNY37_06890 [Henriciella sp. AS95]|uniref:hypothetical protein n=1 Tax=Henriciella sp. AS95 TaxID=3135782 RepID=UPI00317F7B4B
MRVPVRHWRTLFHYLGCLQMTFETARAEGRGWITWHLRPDGVIWISAWEETEAEKRAKCALPDGFDRTPWTRLEPGYDARFLAPVLRRLARTQALAALMLSAATGLALNGAGADASGLSSLPFLSPLTHPGSPLLFPP